ncbi:hypothetical protein K439DRAFT_1634308, partial [Ramaria rubella]
AQSAKDPTNHVNFVSLLTNLRLLKVDAVFSGIELGILLSQPQLHIVQLCNVDCSEAATWGYILGSAYDRKRCFPLCH